MGGARTTASPTSVAGLILQGREVFEQAVADPDALTDLAAIRSAAARRAFLECESMLYVPAQAYRAATGEELPAGAYTTRLPELGRRLGLRRLARHEAATTPPDHTVFCSMEQVADSPRGCPASWYRPHPYHVSSAGRLTCVKPDHDICGVVREWRWQPSVDYLIGHTAGTTF